MNRARLLPCLVVISFFALLFNGCGGGSKPINLALNFSGTQAIDNGQSVSITVTGAGNKGVMWSLASVGMLTNMTTTSVTYTAPAAPATGTDHLTATSLDNSAKTVTLTINVTPSPSITTASPLQNGIVGTAYNQTVTATGGAGTLTFAVSAGTLPAGLTMSSAGAITGTPTAVGTSSFTVKVTDSSIGGPQSATKMLSITVNQAAAITSANSVTFVVGTAGTFTVTATGTPTPTLSETGMLPTGVTFTPATGVLSGTPAPGTAANYAITFTASNGIGTAATQNFTLTVGQPPAITSANGTTFTVGTAGTFTVTATGFPAPTFSETGALPAGVTLNTTTGVLSGTPAAGTGKTYSIMFTATNSVGSSAPQSFTLTVNQAPAITSANKTTVTFPFISTFTVTTSGFPVPALTATGMPLGVTFVDNGNGTGTLRVGPQEPVGNYPITFTATNSVGSPASQSFTLTVGQIGGFTSANNATFTVGTVGTFTVTTNGFPAPSLSESGALPNGVTFTDNGDGTGTLSGTPAAGTGKTYAIMFTATNSVGSSAPQSFTLTIDQAPAITSANSTTFSVGAMGTFTVTATGFPAPTFGESGTLPTGVTFNTTTGVLSGTPGAGTAGTYSIMFTASNGVGSPATQSFTLTVNTAPVITSANSTTFTVGTPGTFTVTATGTPSPTLSETGTLPTGVTFNPGTGVLSGTPAAGTGGTYSITFKASNSVGSNSQIFTLTVDEAPSITSPSSTTFTVGVSGSFTVMTTGFPKPSLTEAGALPSGVTFVDNGNGTGTLSGTPASGSLGTYSITFTATNTVGTPAMQSFTLTVNTAPVITSANNTRFTVGTPGTFTVMTTGTPTPALSETGTLPTGVTFTDNHNGTATLAGTPAAGTGAGYSITIKATSSSGSTSQSFLLTVLEAPTITSANSTTFSVGSLGTFTVTTTGFPLDPITETGALPSGVTFVDNGNNTATLSGTPAAGTAASYPITITASNGVLPNATQSFTLTVNAGGGVNAGLLKGQYFLEFQSPGGLAGQPAFVEGTITADGSGNIPSGSIDVNSGFTFTSNQAITGTYTINADRRGTIKITGGSQNFTGVLTVQSANQTFVTEFDATSQGFGTLSLNPGPFSNANLTGPYILAEGGHEFGLVGQVNFDGAGHIPSGTVDINTMGTILPMVSVSGTYNITNTATGRGDATVNTSLPPPNNTFTFVIYENGNGFALITTNPSSPFRGVGQAQTGPFSAGSISGNFILQDGSDRDAGAGEFTADGVSGFSSGIIDINGGSGPHPEVTFTAPYSISSNGRGTATFNPSVGSPDPIVFWVRKSGRATFVDNGSGSGVLGELRQQTGTPPPTIANIKGNYSFYIQGCDVVATNCVNSFTRSGLLAFDGNGNVILSEDVNDGQAGTQTSRTNVAGTYTVGTIGLGPNEGVITFGTDNSIHFFVADVPIDLRIITMDAAHRAIGEATLQQ